MKNLIFCLALGILLPLSNVEAQFAPVDTVGCSKILPTSDGLKKGFVSKTADTAHFGAWTVLFPRLNDKKGRPINPYKKVESWKNGKSYFSWKSPYLFAEDKSYRAVWRANHGTDKAFKNTVLRATNLQGKTDCFKIPDPRKRYD